MICNPLDSEDNFHSGCQNTRHVAHNSLFHDYMYCYPENHTRQTNYIFLKNKLILTISYRYKTCGEMCNNVIFEIAGNERTHYLILNYLTKHNYITCGDAVFKWLLH